MLDLPEHGSADTGFGREAVAGPTEKLARGQYLSARDHISPLGCSVRMSSPSHDNTEAAVVDGAECKLAIEFKGRVMDMREEGRCTSFRGLTCYFGGSLTRVQTGGR
jgi:hypothetical protein